MCIKTAIGKTAYYSKNIFVVDIQSKLFIQISWIMNIIEECGPTMKKIWLAFNSRCLTKKHMDIKVYLVLGYKKNGISNWTGVQRQYSIRETTSFWKKRQLFPTGCIATYWTECKSICEYIIYYTIISVLSYIRWRNVWDWSDFLWGRRVRWLFQYIIYCCIC